MIFKVFYQETKTRSPRRETTRALYLDLDVASKEAGVIQARELVKDNTEYHVEFVDVISDEMFAYEKETGAEITHF